MPIFNSKLWVYQRLSHALVAQDHLHPAVSFGGDIGWRASGSREKQQTWWGPLMSSNMAEKSPSRMNTERERDRERCVYIYIYIYIRIYLSLSTYIGIHTHTYIYITHTHIYTVCVYDSMRIFQAWMVPQRGYRMTINLIHQDPQSKTPGLFLFFSHRQVVIKLAVLGPRHFFCSISWAWKLDAGHTL